MDEGTGDVTSNVVVLIELRLWEGEREDMTHLLVTTFNFDKSKSKITYERVEKEGSKILVFSILLLLLKSQLPSTF